jgi:hypothetical protein
MQDTITPVKNFEVTTTLKQPNMVLFSPLENSSRIFLIFYVYVELLEPGQGKRPVKKVVKIGQAGKRYTVDNQASYNRVHTAMLEKATGIAMAELYRLKDAKQPFARVFISKFGNVNEAKQDPDAFNYTLAQHIQGHQ